MMQNKLLLSLCMIVKDEEIYLPQCLNSVKDVVDEIIIVDTGSTDNTPNIARQYGASVYDYAWQDDFAAARNFGLDKAKGVFILILDADEELSPDAQTHLRSFLSNTTAEGIYLIVRSFGLTNALAPYYDSEQVRLFRNRSQYRFENAIHEMIYPSIVAQHGTLYKSQFVIHHFGYLKNMVQGTESRIARDRRLLERMYLDNPDSVYTKAKLGFIYLLEHEYPKAFHLLQEVTREIDGKTADPDFLHSVFLALAQTAQAMGEYRLSKECAKAGYLLKTQPYLTRSSMFYYATSSVAWVLEQVEKLAYDSSYPLSKPKVLEDLQVFKEEIEEASWMLAQLVRDIDLTPQAKETLTIWQRKIDRVDQLLEAISADLSR